MFGVGNAAGRLGPASRRRPRPPGWPALLAAAAAAAAACLGSTAGPAPGDPGTPAAFDKPAPEGVEDLRAMQAHFRALADRVAPTAVHLRDAEGGVGSGVIVSEDGYILSCRHVTGDAGRPVTVVLADGRRMKAETVEADRDSDASLLKIVDGRGLPAARLGRSSGLGPGRWCMALGYPRGVPPPPVVRVGRVVARGGRGDARWLFTDCVIEGGDSGGPLFDLEGRVVGIHGIMAGGGSLPDDNGHVRVEALRGLDPEARGAVTAAPGA